MSQNNNFFHNIKMTATTSNKTNHKRGRESSKFIDPVAPKLIIGKYEKNSKKGRCQIQNQQTCWTPEEERAQIRHWPRHSKDPRRSACHDWQTARDIPRQGTDWNPRRQHTAANPRTEASEKQCRRAVQSPAPKLQTRQSETMWIKKNKLFFAN